jgi:hypothetical protein
MYVDTGDCVDRVTAAAQTTMSSCPRGVDKRRLDGCLDTLENQACDADMGPVSALCNSPCSP